MNGKNQLPKNILSNFDRLCDKMAQKSFTHQFLMGAASGW